MLSFLIHFVQNSATVYKNIVHSCKNVLLSSSASKQMQDNIWHGKPSENAVILIFEDKQTD